MRVMIEGASGVLFDAGAGENALVPSDEGERAQVFEALVGALALLGGIKPPMSSSATAGETDARSVGTERCQSGHTGGDLVHLSERRGRPTRSSSYGLPGPDQSSY